ncbi:EamA-like transporter family protein [Kitasatospora sp. SolWspMP-SS2h]|uniref:DMT family transporter n=1 Tax=Kitasatospora sp. SolWspMP-SS2h TaxID=1305729 RepID=UPI000DB8FB43|nr:DMT family transporter [Kitasatospora sp. SolWspMP-SS2h]RAJ41766.1 EamA-like transporter family protein [Kitasatospora sp. SolWspMP-SS2h]
MSQGAVPFVVLAAALLHAVWNALVHGVRDRMAGIAQMNLVFVAFGGALALSVPAPGAGALPYLLASAALQTGYQLLLVRAYGLGDFGQLYPIARGTSPAVVALLSATVLHRPLPAGQFAAVVVISLGLAGLALVGGVPGRDQLPAIGAALGNGVLIAGYTVVDAGGVRAAHSAAGYIAWMFLLQGLAVLAAVAAVRRGTLRPALREGRAVGLAGGLMSLTAYGLVVWAQTVGDLPTIAALRETSIVIAALIGTLVLRERLGALRLAASATVLAGIALLELAH